MERPPYLFLVAALTRIRRQSACYLFVALNVIITYEIVAQEKSPVSTSELKKLSVEELMNVEVTSVSKRAERLTEVASAIQVISQEDIRRSAATSLPEALRLASNLQVAQLNSYAWIISARGFNGVFSNKLLVMVDGRTVYSPLFAGVFWDAQSVLLEDIERIEVISGPGGTLWGANAVNGVINIITKHAVATQNLYVSTAAGSIFRRHYAMRYGGTIGSKFSYRVFAQHNNRDNMFINDSTDSPDKWYYSQAGFQVDWDISETDKLMVQSNFYLGTEKTFPAKSTFDGQNALGRWSHSFSDKTELVLQAYYDRSWRRDIPSTISDELDTYDLDLQHRFPVRTRHTILWGGGYRLMKDKSQHSTGFVGFVPEKRDMHLFSGFIQDEIEIVPDKIKLTLGTKLQHNVFSGFDVQPSVRAAWTPVKSQTLWGAVSRAVRAPSRIDVDYHLPTYEVPPGSLNVDGGPNFISEKVIAYELGYRVQPLSSMSFSLAAFYNEYDDIYTVEALPPPDNFTFQIQNGAKGYSYGLELSGAYQIADVFRLRGGYTYFVKELENKPGHTFNPVQLADLGHDAQDQCSLQSIWNLPLNFQLDITARYISRLPDFMPDYFNFDTRLAWVYNKWELSLVGQNLFEERHREYSVQIPRSIYVKITCRIF
jgi:iron complex outermembrane receptor protein